MKPKYLVAVIALACGMGGAVQAQDAPRQPHTYFLENAKLKADEIRDIENGKAFAKIVDTGEKPEVVIFGAVYVRAPMESFVAAYRDVEGFAKMNNYLAVGRFSDPPQPSDVSNLTLDEDDIKALKKCKPGDCDVQLPTKNMQEFKQKIDWSSSNAADQANAMARETILDLIARYKKDGNAALGVYQDKKYDMAVDETFQTILSRVDGLSKYLSEVQTYLLGYPNAKLSDAEDFFYWEKVKFGLRPTIRANHVVIHQASHLENSPYVMVNKQLYASHYFQVAVDFWLCVKDSANPDAEGFFLITEKGSRQHGLTGFKGTVARSVAVPRARGSMEKGLATIKQALEKK